MQLVNSGLTAGVMVGVEEFDDGVLRFNKPSPCWQDKQLMWIIRPVTTTLLAEAKQNLDLAFDLVEYHTEKQVNRCTYSNSNMTTHDHYWQGSQSVGDWDSSFQILRENHSTQSDID